MRTLVVSSGRKLLSIFFAVALLFGLAPAAAFADAMDENDASEPFFKGGDILNEEMLLEPIAQAESTKSYFLVRTLESTRTVPVVSAKLPIDDGSDGESAGSEERAGEADLEGGVSAGSTVVGAFEQNGMTFAVEPDGGSVALVAVDRAKLPQGSVEERKLAVPEVASSGGATIYSVARIADGALSSLSLAVADATASDGEEPSTLDGESLLGPAVEEIPSSSIDTVFIPASVMAIEDGAFSGDDMLQHIVVSEGNRNYSSYDGCLYDKPQTSLLLIPEGRVGAVRIASSAVNVDPEVFSHCPSVDEIIADEDSAAFTSVDGCLYNIDESVLLRVPRGMESVSIAVLCEQVGPRAFGCCIDVATVKVLGNISHIDESAFASSGKGIDRAASKELIFDPSNVEVYLASGEGRAEWDRYGFRVILGEPDAPESAILRAESERRSDYAAMAGSLTYYSNLPCTLYTEYWENSSNVNSYTTQTPRTVPNVLRFTSRIDYVDHYFDDIGSSWDGVHPQSPAGYDKPRFYLDSGYSNEMVAHKEYPITQYNAVYIKFNPSEYPIYYELNGGYIANQRKTYTIETNDFALVNPTRPGYSFAGWAVSGGAGTGIAGNGTSAVTVKKGTYGNLTASAKWHLDSYSIAYDDNGGAFSGKTVNYNVESADFKLPTSGTREGYIFAGWDVMGWSGVGVTGNGTVDVTVKKGTYGWLTAKAKWTPIAYSVTYDDAGGSFTGKTGSYTIESNDFALPASGMRTGFTFAGWEVTGASGAGIEGNGTTSVTVKKGTYGNLAAKAIWTINVYHLSWSASHGTHANRTEDFTVEDCPIAMGEAVPDAGYAFLGWSGTGIAEGSASFALTDSMLEGRGDGETFAYAASFAANPYTARLHANDGTDAVAEHAVTYDAPVSPASVPKRYGYAFSGYWTKGADGSKEELYFDEEGSYVRDDVWKDPSDVDLYACWTLMANLEVPVNAPSAVSFTVDRALEIGEDATGTQAGPSVTGALRSSVPQEVPIASIELEPLQDADGTASASRVLGEGNPERCGVEVSLGSSPSALLRLADATGSPLRWEPPSPLAIPAAVPVASGTTGEDVTSDSSGNLARLGELPLSYAMRLFSGFDVYRMPAEDASSEPVARIVFTVDLTGLEHEEF